MTIETYQTEKNSIYTRIKFNDHKLFIYIFIKGNCEQGFILIELYHNV